MARLLRTDFTPTDRIRLADAVLGWTERLPDPTWPLLIISGAAPLSPLDLAEAVRPNASDQAWSEVEGLFTIPAAEYTVEAVIASFRQSGMGESDA